MDKRREISIIQNKYEDDTNRKFIQHMCRNCKFYDNKCNQKRNVRKCAEKGLKNKD